jgi:hypothetical protein
MPQLRIARQRHMHFARVSAAGALGMLVAACTPADVPDVPAPVAPGTAEEEPGLHAPPLSPAADAACRQLDAMLSGIGYGEARMRLQAAGYRVPEAAGGPDRTLAGDAAVCDARTCTVDYIADGEEPLRLTATIDTSQPDEEWRIEAWDRPSCRPTP